MDKSPDAFRTISEVAEVLQTPAHVLRFWESRFPQIRPVKRAGGRRYYRPADVALLLGIKHLLHNEGMTIRGVQKILREQGVRHVAGLSGHDLPEDSENAEAALEAALAANFGNVPEAEQLPLEQVETAQIVALEDALRARAARDEQAALDGTGPEQGAAPVADPPRIAEQLTADDLAAAAPAPQADPEPEPALTPDTLPDAPAAEPVARLPADAPLLERLRALPRGSLAMPEAAALRDRLAALAARVAAPPPPASF